MGKAKGKAARRRRARAREASRAATPAALASRASRADQRRGTAKPRTPFEVTAKVWVAWLFVVSCELIGLIYVTRQPLTLHGALLTLLSGLVLTGAWLMRPWNPLDRRPKPPPESPVEEVLDEAEQLNPLADDLGDLDVEAEARYHVALPEPGSWAPTPPVATSPEPTSLGATTPEPEPAALAEPEPLHPKVARKLAALAAQDGVPEVGPDFVSSEQLES